MNLTEVLNVQHEAAKKDLQAADKAILDLKDRHKKELDTARAMKKLLESILKDIEGKIEKLKT